MPPINNKKNTEMAAPTSDQVALGTESVPREKKGLCRDQKPCTSQPHGLMHTVQEKLTPILMALASLSST